MSHSIFRRMIAYMLCGFLSVALAEAQKSYALQEGDVVFSSSTAGQGGAIIIATRSPYSHCGMVFVEKGKMMVLEAVQPVGVVSLEEFISRSKPGTFMARRLKTPVNPASYQTAKSWGMSQIGKNYDAKFLWDDRNLYCSELVWKIYQHAGVELCIPRRFKDYHLDDPTVKKVIEERYGSMQDMPQDEKVVAPADLAASFLLEEVTKQ
jgi:uncharacterized protein YunC (DUF1805 family)